MIKNVFFSFIFLLISSCAANTAGSKKNEENLAKQKMGMEVVALDTQSDNSSGLSHGVLVNVVYGFYPAQKAGILKGDIIISLDDQTIFDLDGFNTLLQRYKYTYGQVTLGVSRKGQIQKIKVHLE